MLIKNNKLILQVILIVFAVGLLIYACTGHNHTNDLQHYIEQLKTNSRKHPKPTPAIALPTPVVYDENSGRPPFGEIPKTQQQNGAGATKPTNPLLGYALSVLKFVGTVSQANGTVAFISAPDGMIYQVTVGSEIGDRQGKVIDIQEGRLQIMEQSAKTGNGSDQRIVTLQLKDEQS